MSNWTHLDDPWSGTSQFLRLVSRSGCAAELERSGPLTVLAPHNRAMATLNPDAWSRSQASWFLRNHLLPGKQLAQELSQRMAVLSLAGTRHDVTSRGELRIGEASFLDVNLEMHDIVFHVIDRPLVQVEKITIKVPAEQTSLPDNSNQKSQTKRAKHAGQKSKLGIQFVTRDGSHLAFGGAVQEDGARPRTQHQSSMRWVVTG